MTSGDSDTKSPSHVTRVTVGYGGRDGGSGSGGKLPTVTEGYGGRDDGRGSGGNPSATSGRGFGGGGGSIDGINTCPAARPGKLRMPNSKSITGVVPVRCMRCVVRRGGGVAATCIGVVGEQAVGRVRVVHVFVVRAG